MTKQTDAKENLKCRDIWDLVVDINTPTFESPMTHLGRIIKDAQCHRALSTSLVDFQDADNWQRNVTLAEWVMERRLVANLSGPNRFYYHTFYQHPILSTGTVALGTFSAFRFIRRFPLFLRLL